VQIGWSAGPAAAHAGKTGAGVVARSFAGGDLFICLGIGHAGVDALENLFFGEPGIFQARDFGTAECPAPLQVASKNDLDEVVRESDQAQRHGIAADGVELVGARDFQNLRFGVTSIRQVCGGITADKRMPFFVSSGDQGHAGVIAQPGLLGLYELRHFGIGGVERLELLEAAGPHAGLVQRTIVGQRMLLAARKEDTGTEKQSARLHASIVAGATGAGPECALADTWASGQAVLVLSLWFLAVCSDLAKGEMNENASPKQDAGCKL
jgi:hypothetical protein